MSTPDNSGEPNLYALLVANAEVLALAGREIYQGRARSNAGELYVVWQRVGGAPGATFCGHDDLVPGEYQVDIYGADDQAVLNLARAIRRALLDHSGPIGAVRVHQILITGDFDSVDPDPGLARRTQTYTVWYAED